MRLAIIASLTVLLSLLTGCSGPGSRGEQPNVVILMTDDQGYGDLGVHGNPLLQTPHLDKLYRQSVRLTDFHVSPTCAPTRAALMTGRYSNRTGVWHTVMGRSFLGRAEKTMAEIFASHGYRTGIFGKWHLGDNYPFRPQDRGFQQSVVHGGGGVGQIPDFWGNDYFDDTYLDRGQARAFEGYCTDVWFSEAIDFIEQHREVPFFCYLATNAPHSPYRVDDRYSRPYGESGVTSSRASFYGMITNIDENLGRLISLLDRLDLTRKTIFIFLTDNGTAEGAALDRNGFVIDGFNAGMRGKKGSQFEGGHRVPFFIRWPDGGLEGGRDISELTAHIDVLPTVMELCGIPFPDSVNFDGVSLERLLTGKVQSLPERVLVVDSQRLEYPIKWRRSAVMSSRFRLIDGTRLFDVRSDPGQVKDVAAEYPQEVDHLRSAYQKWWEGLGPSLAAVERIVVGKNAGEISRLTSHDWHYVELPDSFGSEGERNPPWNQRQVTRGYRANGTWTLEVAQSGAYEIVLTRWPLELDWTLGSPGEAGSESEEIGVSLAISGARIEAGERRIEWMVDQGDRGVVQQMRLDKGALDLKASFLLGDGDTVGAYYAYLKRLE
ncbi:MAG: arylsulfatase [Acidobacteriota bacterium]|nr:MAG: arylsulfatase [Acidobacteriota bacterium]